MSRSDTADKPTTPNIQGVEINLVKNNNEQKPTVTVLEGNKRDEHPPRQPNPIRAALKIEGKNMQTV